MQWRERQIIEERILPSHCEKLRFAEDQLLSISALQHLLFCPRQCALIHSERQWAENRLTAEGQRLHRKVHREETRQEGGKLVTSGLLLRSFRLGIFGKADAVEFEPPRNRADLFAAPPKRRAGSRHFLPNELGDWQVTPVEYKRGRPKTNDCDLVQLCAQAICLEEMLQIKILAGSIFYGVRRRRLAVNFDAGLRARTEEAARNLHELLESEITPPARHEPKCDRCSLINLCLPQALSRTKSADEFFRGELSAHFTAAGPKTDTFDIATEPHE